MELSAEYIMLIQFGIVPAIIGIVQACKNAGLKSEYAPFLAIALGGAGSFLLGGFNPFHFMAGVLAGLGAVGLYDATNIKKDTFNVPKPPQ